MADQINRLDVLIASPSDVKAERELAARIIEELNRMLEKQHVQLRARMWEYDTVSQIGGRPQEIVNDQIADKCDIFVGIMWSRVGSPTGEERSGTIEEFRRAKARLDVDGRSVRVLFFFCSKALPFDIDIDQLKAVRTFRSEVEQLGLISTFTSPDEFGLKFRQAIHQHATEWGVKWGPIAAGMAIQTEGIAPVVTDIAGDETEEVGYIDAIEEATEHIDIAAAALGRMGEAIEELGKNLEQRTIDINRITKVQPVDLKRAKRVSNQAADHFETFSTRFLAEYPIQQKALARALERMSDVVLLSQDFANAEKDQSELAAAQETLSGLKSHMEGSLANTIYFRQSIVEIPRMTTRFNGARRQAERALAEFIEGTQENMQLIDTILAQIGEITGEDDPN